MIETVYSCALISTLLRPTFGFHPSSPLLLSRCGSILITERSNHQITNIKSKHSTKRRNQIINSSTSRIFALNVLEYSDDSIWNTEGGGDDDDGGGGGDDVGDDDDEEEQHRIWSANVNDAIKILEKKKNSLEAERRKIDGAELIGARAQLLVSNLYLFKDGTQSATIVDWENDGKEVELKLDSNKYKSASAEADALFSTVRKLKRGSKRVDDLLEETLQAWEILNEAKSDLESIVYEQRSDTNRMNIIKKRLIRTSKATKFQIPAVDDVGDSSNLTKKKREGKHNNKNRREKKPNLGTPASNVRKLLSPGGCTVLVGRNRRGNEYLSLSVARGNDVWMHSRGCPGAHVIIQNRRGSKAVVTDDCLQFCADLAIFYSDMRNEQKAEVTAAEPKHIQKPRGAPLGAVKVRQEWKTFVGRPWAVPEKLKEAREESGQSEDYHMFDKAKHRRKTKQVAEEHRAKRKQQQKDKKSRN